MSIAQRGSPAGSAVPIAARDRARPGLIDLIIPRICFVALASCAVVHVAHAASPEHDPCSRPAPGAEVPEPRNLNSEHGVLKVNLSIHDYREPDGSVRYCYLLPDGTESPALRLHRGDLLILHLKNDLTEVGSPSAPGAAVGSMVHSHMRQSEARAGDPCTSGAMTPTSTNLHFHGTTLPPVCHQDDVLRTSIQPGDAPFEYRFRIPANEPPGLYWYHPHIHGFSSQEVGGGASGPMIIEGLERSTPEVAGLPERVLVIRDQSLLNPNAPPSKSEPVVPKMLIDRDGDAANNGTGFGKPARDLSVNFVPVPYPDYPPATIRMRPGERQLWRVLNACAVTYLNLAVVFGRTPQRLGLVAIDGVPMNAPLGRSAPVTWVDHIGVPPGARVEFIMQGPPVGTPALFVTRFVDTGQGGENDPNRALASIIATADAREPQSKLPAFSTPLPPPALPWLGEVKPVRVRRFYFSEKLLDPKNPNSATEFYITEEGKTPAPFDPTAAPDIVVHQGDVEDWIIENRSTELHAFHIHQLHFELVGWETMAVDEPFLRDTVNVPYFRPQMLQYPSVRLRMDFRDPNTVGTFVYHCHLLEHEDGGMMGTIRVLPAGAPPEPAPQSPAPAPLESAH
jgi:FtsP/CotA-like multicopper oxidase with cupredoxin domain